MITLEDFEGDALEVLIEGFTIGNESTKYAISYNDAYYASINNPGEIKNHKFTKYTYKINIICFHEKFYFQDIWM